MATDTSAAPKNGTFIPDELTFCPNSEMVRGDG